MRYSQSCLKKKCYILRVVTIKVIYTSEGLSNRLFNKCDVVNHHVCTSIMVIKFSCLLEKTSPQLTFTPSKSTMKKPEQCVKSVQS